MKKTVSSRPEVVSSRFHFSAQGVLFSADYFIVASLPSKGFSNVVEERMPLVGMGEEDKVGREREVA